MLDPILEAYVEDDLTAPTSIAAGLRPELVGASPASSTWPSTSAASHPPGLRITPKAFGKDRRLPITNRYRG